MTATVNNATRELYPTKWRTDYVARIVGPDRRYGVELEWCDRGKRDRTYGKWVDHAGVYESRIQNVRRFELFDGSGWIGIPNVRDLSRRVTPDVLRVVIATLTTRTAKVWDEQCCMCASTVERFSADGWPTCEAHAADIGQPEPDTVEVRFSESEVPF